MLIRAATVLLCAIAGFYVAKWTVMYLYPFLIACLLATFIHPIVTFIEKKMTIPRAVASALVIFTGLFVFMGGIVILIAEVVQGTAYLAQSIPKHITTFNTIIQKWIHAYIIPLYEKFLSLFNTLNTSQKDAIQDQIDHILSSTSAASTTFIQNGLLKIPTLLSFFPMSITILILIILATFFITNDWYHIKHIWFNSIPSRVKLPSIRVWQSFTKTLIGYFKAQMILVVMSASTIYIGLLVLNIDQALTVALLIALVDLVPLVGTGIVFIPWIIYMFLSAQYPLTIGLSLLYMIIVIGRQVIEPKILSTHIGINPLIALVGLFVGIRLFGLIGLILTPFLLIIISTFHQTGVFKGVLLFIQGKDNYLR